ncbi:hypothetical protein F5884DRAFT_674939 [Xylogone sp. PMI_703]|nr:hypothetical protein F5884DRAFT_674939 [Xylogone sp. PMI_703]
MYHRRACDRCYRYKEKCDFEGDTQICTLCRRSGSICKTLRSRLRQGRPPHPKHFDSNTSVQVWDIRKASVDSNRSHDLAKHHGQLSTTIYQWSPWLVQKFYAIYNIFMLGPTFAPTFRAAIQQSYICSPTLLHDVLTAIFTAIKRARYVVDPSDLSDVAKGARSLQTLRTARIGSAQDALPILVLGQTLAAFDFLTNCIGSSLILRYSLSSVQPWYEELLRNPTFDPVTVTPIFWDTISCLVKCEIPVVRFRPSKPHTVDRLAGLCTTLLPLFYDLCAANNKLKRLRASGVPVDITTIERIQKKLLSWTPKESQDITTTFSKEEILGMKTQALMYQTAGLLVAHRALNPIGKGDDIATLYANKIKSEFLKSLTLAGPSTRVHHVAFPILMASLEITNVPEDIWENITLLTIAPEVFTKMKDFIGYVWTERSRGFVGYISELVDQGPDFVVIP